MHFILHDILFEPLDHQINRSTQYGSQFTNPLTYTKDTLPKTIGAYPSMNRNQGSHLLNGKFHWELYETASQMVSQSASQMVNETNESKNTESKYDWETLRQHIQTFGLRNSLLVALMPTASTSQLLGNNECFEPYTSNIYKRKTLAGEFIIINKQLVNDLYRMGLWNQQLKEYLIASEGSVQYIDGLPDELKSIYKTAWELSPEVLIRHAIERQPYVDQGQSLNWYIEDLTLKQFTKLSFQDARIK